MFDKSKLYDKDYLKLFNIESKLFDACTVRVGYDREIGGLSIDDYHALTAVEMIGYQNIMCSNFGPLRRYWCELGF